MSNLIGALDPKIRTRSKPQEQINSFTLNRCRRIVMTRGVATGGTNTECADKRITAASL